ncbi:hypothetical protein CYMTET_38888 [Cymbomonas tetramitiformis]|uniref:Uncharacterized protein n=1 Tax=Cymbomonas tetramitiformis TaxID=36881 RepID=A0AAE0F4T6_9CHLO|nr:hypothetical protein CYMTET_38888 [Cymbomonas tetramitiformis]
MELQMEVPQEAQHDALESANDSARSKRRRPSRDSASNHLRYKRRMHAMINIFENSNESRRSNANNLTEQLMRLELPLP